RLCFLGNGYVRQCPGNDEERQDREGQSCVLNGKTNDIHVLPSSRQPLALLLGRAAAAIILSEIVQRVGIRLLRVYLLSFNHEVLPCYNDTGIRGNTGGKQRLRCVIDNLDRVKDNGSIIFDTAHTQLSVWMQGHHGTGQGNRLKRLRAYRNLRRHAYWDAVVRVCNIDFHSESPGLRRSGSTYIGQRTRQHLAIDQ